MLNKLTLIALFSVLCLILLGLSNIPIAYADCPCIENLQVQPENDGVLISGTSCSACKSVEVNLYCDKRHGSKGYKVTPNSGSWEQYVTLDTLSEINCNCGDTIEISVACFKNKDTTDFICGESFHLDMPCEDKDDCPTVTLSANQLQCSDRNPDGTWPVQFNITSQNDQFTGSYNLFYGDGQSESAASSTTNISHLYSCPLTYPPYSVSIMANGCESDPFYTASDSISLEFPSCECPEIGDITNEINECTARFSTTVSVCSDSVPQYIWNFGDGSTETTNSPQSSAHSYSQNGSYDITVTLAGVGNNCSKNTTINILDCDSDGDDPGDDDDNDDGDDGNGNGDGDDDGNGNGDNGNGDGDDDDDGNGNGDNGNGDGDEDDGNGNGDDDNGNGEGDGGDSSICGIFDWCCWLLALFVGLYIAFWIMWNYNIIPPAWYIGIAALIAFLLWLFICQPTYCGVLIVLFAAGIVALAIMGVIALIPGTPNPPIVVPSSAGSYPAAILAVITLIIIPILFGLGGCAANCNDFTTCLQVLWERATAGR